jgi:hypothetical protein
MRTNAEQMRRNTCFTLFRIIFTCFTCCAHIAAELMFHICFTCFHIFPHFSHVTTYYGGTHFFTCVHKGFTCVLHVFTCFLSCVSHIVAEHVFTCFHNFHMFSYVRRFPALHRFEHCNTSNILVIYR